MTPLTQWLREESSLHTEGFKEIEKISWYNLGVHLGLNYPNRNEIKLLLMFLERVTDFNYSEQTTQVISGWLSKQEKYYSCAAKQYFNLPNELVSAEPWEIWVYLGAAISQSLGVDDGTCYTYSLEEEEQGQRLIRFLQAVPGAYKNYFVMGVGFAGYGFSQ